MVGNARSYGATGGEDAFEEPWLGVGVTRGGSNCLDRVDPFDGVRALVSSGRRGEEGNADRVLAGRNGIRRNVDVLRGDDTTSPDDPATGRLDGPGIGDVGRDPSPFSLKECVSVAGAGIGDNGDGGAACFSEELEGELKGGEVECGAYGA